MSSIDPATDIFDWGNSLEDKNVHEQVHLLKNKIKPRVFFTTIFLKKTIICNDKCPSCFNNEIRKIRTTENEIFD